GGVNGPILVLFGPTDASEVGHAVAQDLILTVWDLTRARAVSEAASALRRTTRVHFKVDTGLTRLGAPMSEAPTRYRAIRALPHLEIDGIFTHFATADEPETSNDRAQLARFREVVGTLSDRPRLVHAAASAGVAARGSMGLVMLDVTEIADVREGDDVSLIGTQGGITQSADDLAAVCGTISYEILTGIRRRVPRRYFRGGKLVATRTLAEGYHAQCGASRSSSRWHKQP